MFSLNLPFYCSKRLLLVQSLKVPLLQWQQLCFWLPFHNTGKGSMAEHNVQRSINSLPLGLWSTYPRGCTPAPPISDALMEQSWGRSSLQFLYLCLHLKQLLLSLKPDLVGWWVCLDFFFFPHFFFFKWESFVSQVQMFAGQQRPGSGGVSAGPLLPAQNTAAWPASEGGPKGRNEWVCAGPASHQVAAKGLELF